MFHPVCFLYFSLHQNNFSFKTFGDGVPFRDGVSGFFVRKKATKLRPQLALNSVPILLPFCIFCQRIHKCYMWICKTFFKESIYKPHKTIYNTNINHIKQQRKSKQTTANNKKQLQNIRRNRYYENFRFKIRTGLY